MSLAFSFPGLYVQEIPLESHAIVPAPTSIAAFVGYSHPFLTRQFGVAVQVFSFADYQAAFGGLYSSGLVDSNLVRAVFQFFLNGGSSAWIVGLQAKALDISGSPVFTGSSAFGTGSTDLVFSATVPSTTSGAGIVFTALEMCDRVPMVVTIANLRQSSPSSPLNTFDVVITYGVRVETYRGVVIGGAANLAPGAQINGVSSLVQVSSLSGGFGTALGGPSSVTIGATSLAINGTPPSGVSLPANFATTFSPADFAGAFDTNSSLDKVEVFNLLLVPGISDNFVVSSALSFAERKRAFAVLDPPLNAVSDNLTDPGAVTMDQYATVIPKSQNGAVYFPYLLSTDPVTDTTVALPPSGSVAGIYARIDASRGVWKAPAGLEANVLNSAGPVTTGLMNDPRQGVYNVLGINVLRSFNAIGTVVFGARTLVGADANTAFPQSKYVPVRRMTLFIEQSLVANLKWAVFEPNDEPLWIALRTSIEAFLLSLFNQGALQGSTPSEAFQVKVDSTTTTPTDQQNGIVNIIVAFAPLKPAEFVVIKISQLAGQTAGT